MECVMPLRRAHQRTFNLQKRLQEMQPIQESEPDVDDVLQKDANVLFAISKSA